MSTSTTALPPMERVLRDDRMYASYDRFVCSRVSCAGSTAVHTGWNIDGVQLEVIGVDEVAEWATYGIGPLRCSCGRLEATTVAADSRGAATVKIVGCMPPSGPDPDTYRV